MNKKMLIPILVAAGIGLFIGLAYAFYNLVVKGEGTIFETESGALEITYKDDEGISLSDAYPGSSFTKEFSVENTGTKEQTYALYFDITTNTYVNDELTYSIINNDTKETVAEGVVPKEKTALTETLPIEASEKHNYTLTVTFIETGKLQNSNLGASFSGKIVIEENTVCATNAFAKGTLKYKMLSDNCAYADNVNSEYVNNETPGVSFMSISSDTNGKGLYYTNALEEVDENHNNVIDNPVYYYRGDVTNNNVVFAGYCWRIVRTNEDGSVRLRYNGTPTITDEVTTCPTTGTSVNALSSTTEFNTDSNLAKYFGYTFSSGTTDTSLYGSTNSTIKTAIEDWYEQNIYYSDVENQVINLDVVNKISEDAIYCGDRSNPTIGRNDNTYYGASNRLIDINFTGNSWSPKIEIQPIYKCPDIKNDGYTISGKTIGNGYLKYPVGLLTYDELSFAGASFLKPEGINNNQTFFLYTENQYWSMSPFTFAGSTSTTVIELVGPDGYGYFNSVIGKRAALPVISLIPETMIVSGTGEYADPYIIN